MILNTNIFYYYYLLFIFKIFTVFKSQS